MDLLDDLDPTAFRALLRAMELGDQTLKEQRARMDLRGLSVGMPPGCRLETIDAGGVSADHLRPRSARDDRMLIYLHGGGYLLGSPRSIRHFASRLAEAACVPALVPEYRLAPEAPFPAAIEDVLAVYRWALDRWPAERIALAGDSAGAGLALAAALSIRDQGLSPPSALYLISPWVDLANGGASYEAKADSDIFCSAPGLQRMAAAYLHGADPKHPLASPLFAALHGLPPLLIHVGSEEILLSDSTRLAEKAGLARTPVRMAIEPEMLHGYPLFHEHLSAARRAIAEAGAWLDTRLSPRAQRA